MAKNDKVDKVDMAAAMAAYLARGGKVQTCPAGEANATPLRTLHARMERNWKETGDYSLSRPSDNYDGEVGYMEVVREARMNGASPSEALDTGREYWNKR